jgi:hypothetical protein
LRSITPHSVESVDNERPEEEEMAKTKGKKGRKGTGKKKGKKTTADKAQGIPGQIMETLPESPVDLGHESAVPGSPVSEESVEDLKEEASGECLLKPDADHKPMALDYEHNSLIRFYSYRG